MKEDEWFAYSYNPKCSAILAPWGGALSISVILKRPRNFSIETINSRSLEEGVTAKSQFFARNFLNTDNFAMDSNYFVDLNR